MRLWDSKGVTFLGGAVFAAVCGLGLGALTDSLWVTAVGFLVVGLALGLIDRRARAHLRSRARRPDDAPPPIRPNSPPAERERVAGPVLLWLTPLLLIVGGLVALNLGVDWAAWVAAGGVTLMAIGWLFGWYLGDLGIGE